MNLRVRRSPSLHGLFFLAFCFLGAPALLTASSGCSQDAHAGQPNTPEGEIDSSAKPGTLSASGFWREGDGSAVTAEAYDPEQSLAPMLDVVRPAVVSIQSLGESPFGMVGGIGSGFIISADGLVVTNHHVVAGRERFEVALEDGRVFEGRLIGSDPQTDLAVLRLDGAKRLPTVVLGSSNRLRVGDWVIAVGSPMGLAQTVTRGILSAKGRGSLGLYRDGYADFLQTDAAINPGNSGGPLFNLAGEVVGINTAVGGGTDGLGFAVPIDQAKLVLPALIRDGKVARGWMGISGRDEKPAFGVTPEKGAVISDVHSDTPAAKAGLKAGDRVIAMNGQAIDDFESLRTRIGEHPPKDKVKLELIREGQRQVVEVELDERPDPDALARIGSELMPAPQVPGTQPGPGAGADLYGGQPARLGVEIREAPDRIVIERVLEGSVGSRLGLQAGDVIERVNGKDVGSVGDIATALEGDRSGVEVRVRRGQGSHTAVIRQR